ncbi:probable LRR receptor-like serine/threonine-protein kinase At2g23950 [Rosa rugosa]|uniref:probable LRR receptor-like serine/threonine-protein kinase At2g23950 n=1 Tax=Rosa rugosa TaxID=74645 RepID=UPI002B405252|nr:probable LRR receptor-like serine/threonine-protein kinase At2g23950 [Rosa rugosa]
MASISATFVILLFTISFSVSATLSASVIDDLKRLKPPQDFNSTIMKNCLQNPSLRYCSTSSPMDLDEIFKSTIVASHLCNESKNSNCIESFPKVDLRSRPNIAPLYLSFTFFWKYCPLSILSIDLSNASLKSNFPIDVLHCTQIQSLDMSHNELYGDVPIENFSALTNLTVLNLSYNHFSESKISDTLFFKKFNSSSFLHSGLIPDHQKFRIKAIVLLIGFPIFVILKVCCLWWLCFRRPDFLPRMFRRKHRFTPAILKAATNGFSRHNLMGKSASVDIYKGTLRDGTDVRIEVYSSESHPQVIEECKVLVQLCHKNLANLLGWCDNRKLRAIVTEWMEGENLESWLLGSSFTPWNYRLRILMGIVEGMCYLQEQWPEVGYDLRTSSIMLCNYSLDPKISRFKVGNQSSSSRRMYKFGVFLLEMMVNRRPQEEFERGEAGFIEYIRMHYPGNLEQLIDPKMELTQNTVDQAKQAISLGLMCTEVSSNRQPSLEQVFDIVSRAYQSCRVLASHHNHYHRRFHAERGKGHRRVQSR